MSEQHEPERARMSDHIELPGEVVGIRFEDAIGTVQPGHGVLISLSDLAKTAPVEELLDALASLVDGCEERVFSGDGNTTSLGVPPAKRRNNARSVLAKWGRG